MNCLIVDDEAPARNIVNNYCLDIPFITVVGECKNAIEALDSLNSNDIDLIILDINMPRLSGLQMLRTLPKPPLVIITTAFRKYAIEGFELDVVDYLTKPFSAERFLKAIMKANTLHTYQSEKKSSPASIERAQDPDRDKFIFVKSNRALQKIELSQLRYLEAQGDYVTFATVKDDILVNISMTKALEMLPSAFFYRIHKSYIVAIKWIDKIKDDTVHIGRRDIPIGSSFKKEFLKRLNYKL